MYKIIKIDGYQEQLISIIKINVDKSLDHV